MAYQDNLNKIAEEFIMMEEIYSQVRKVERRAQESRVQTYQPKVIDSVQAAKLCGGVLEVTGRRPGVQQGGRHEALPKQGRVGVWIMDYSKRKSKVMPYAASNVMTWN